MSGVNIYLELFRKGSDLSWDLSSPFNLTPYIIHDSFEFEDQVGKAKDTMQFNLYNRNNTLFTAGNTFIQFDDRIRAYSWIGTRSVNTTSDFLTDMTVTNIDLTNTPDGNTIRIQGESFINSFFNMQVWMNTSGDPVSITEQVIAEMNRNLPIVSRKIYGQNSSEWSIIGNPTTKRNGGVFPTQAFNRKYTAAVDLFEELWSDKFTSDSAYIYYLEEDNVNNRFNFKVLAPTQVNVGAITQGGNETSFAIKPNTDDVKNVLIFNCGLDPRDNVMEFFHYDLTSIKRYSARWAYWSKTNYIGGMLLVKEQERNISLFSPETASDGTVRPTVAIPTSFPYTMGFNTRDDVGNDQGSAVVASNATAYVDAFWKESFWQGRTEINNVLFKTAHPLWNVTVQYSRINDPSYSITSLYSVVCAGLGLTGSNAVNLRVMRKNMTLYDTTYELRQDPETVNF